MFNEDEFENYPNFLPILSRFNKFELKGKRSKLEKIIEDLEKHLKEGKNHSIITYIFSIIAEEDFDLLNSRGEIFQKVSNLLNSEKEDVRINSVIIIGFYMKNSKNQLDSIVQPFLKKIADKSKDVRNNVHIFLQEFTSTLTEPALFDREKLIDALTLEEKNPDNALNLLKILNKVQFLSFSQLFKVRDAIISILNNTSEKATPQIKDEILKLLVNLYNLEEREDTSNITIKELFNLVSDIGILMKTSLKTINQFEKKNLNQYLNYIRKSEYHEHEIYFYIKKNSKIMVYEFEKEVINKIFNTDNKINSNSLFKYFFGISDDLKEIISIITMLIKFKHTTGYISELGNFYSDSFLLKEFRLKLQEKGMISLKQYDYLPEKFVMRIIDKINELHNHELLFGKNDKVFYSLSKIKKQITSKASVISSIDLKNYRDRLQRHHFITLIKNLPKDYLTKYRKGTVWLTTIGEQKVLKEINNSKIIGFVDLEKISRDLNINPLLLMDVLNVNIDERSGIWNKEKKVFYYSKFIKNEIVKIQKVEKQEEKQKLVIDLSNRLNIDKNHILSKIDENLKLIGEEILAKDHIRLDDYLEKTGMRLDMFLDYLNTELELEYIKRGNDLLFSKKKIQEARNDVKKEILEDIERKEYLDLSSYDLQADIIKSIIEELQEERGILGIIQKHDHSLYFYTEIGLKNIMLQKKYTFSLSELFYDSDLSEKDYNSLTAIFQSLKDSKGLSGEFNKETLTFTSNEYIFNQSYENLVKDFGNLVNSYNDIFKSEFQTIKEILTKTDEIIFPQEIKLIQEKIDKINDISINWESKLEAFISKATVSMLSKQGLTLKQYRAFSNSLIKEREVINFREDPDVIDFRDQFRVWMSRFYELEQKYPVVIYHQKKLQRDPNDEESKTQLIELKEKLGLS